MSLNQTHVVPHPRGWAYEQAGADRVSRVYGTQKEAISAARKVSQTLGTELIVHGRAGRIRESDSHGHDPCPPRDTV